MKFVKRVIEFELYGKEVKFDAATVSQWENYRNEIAKADGNDFAVMVNFLVKLGMNKQDVLSMQPEHLLELIDEMVSKKK